MGIGRKRALDGIEELVGEVERHLEKLAADPTHPASDHWRGELKAFLGGMRELSRLVGRRTGQMWIDRIGQWERDAGVDDG